MIKEQLVVIWGNRIDTDLKFHDGFVLNKVDKQRIAQAYEVALRAGATPEDIAVTIERADSFAEGLTSSRMV